MVPPKSKIWRYFPKKDNIYSKCNICSKILKISGNTTNLVAHLRQKHYDIHKSAFDVAEANKISFGSSKTSVIEKKSVLNVEDEPQPSTSKTVTPPRQTKGRPRSPSPTCSTSSGSLKSVSFSHSQPTITKTMKTIKSFSEGGSHNAKLTDTIAYFLCKDNMPFSTVEGEGFLKLLKQVCPLYKVPTRNTFKHVIDDKYEFISNIFKDQLKSVEYVTLTSDIWTDAQTKSFLGITIHYIFNIRPISVTLGVIELSESHTAQYISSELLKALSEFNIAIDRVVAAVTDNGANIVKAIHDTFGRNKHVPCFAHTLNLVCENAVKNTDGLNELLQKVRAIVTWVKRSVHASDKLRKQQIDIGIPEGNIKKLILDVKTRWNSTFYMISRFIEIAPYIANIIFENVNAPTMPSAMEISYLKDIVQLLKPLEKMTTEICGEKFITISKVIPMLSCALELYNKKMIPYSEVGQSLKTNLLSEFNKRFGQIEKSHLLATSTMLDPRFKQLHFKDPIACSATISYLRRETLLNASEPNNNNTDHEENSNGVSDNSTEKTFDLWNFHKELTHTKRVKTSDLSESNVYDEVSQYLQSPTPMLSQDPLIIWDEIKTVFPHLYKESQKYLGIVATSVPSERLFSKAGATANKTRNRLTGKRLSKLLFLQSVCKEYWL